jgi:GDPmannose 4,6-dehydratase
MKVLITGITGQDGIFLVRKLLKEYRDIEILGISRLLKTKSFLKLAKIDNLKKNQKLNLVSIDLKNSYFVEQTLFDFFPDKVFNLTGPSSVYESITNPDLGEDIKIIFTNLCNSLIKKNNFCTFFQASTSEMYGLNNQLIRYDENSEFQPNSPYAKGKLHNHLKISQLRKKYDWDISSGIMFNHESEFRKDNYLFMKLINSAYAIKHKKVDKFTVGSLDYSRDWSYAGDISAGIFAISKFGKSFDYVLGSGVETEIRKVIEIIFSSFNLNYENFLEVDANILRKNDPIRMVSNPSKIKNEIGWETNTPIEKIIELIIKSKFK